MKNNNKIIENKYELLVEKNPDCIKLFDLKGNLTYINKGGLKEHRLKNLKQALENNWNIKDTIIDDDKKIFDQAIKDAKNGKVSIIEFNHTHKGSVNETCSELIAPIRESDGSISQIIGISRDISELKRIQRALQENESRLNAIVENIGDAVVVVNKDGKITTFNKQASNISGFKRGEVLGKKYHDIIKFIIGEDKKMKEDFVKTTMRCGKIANIPNMAELACKNKLNKPVDGTASPFKDEKNKIAGCVVVFRDVTKEREVSRMKTEFVSITSHQLRTPLSGIKWFSELLLEEKIGTLNEKQKKFVRQIYNDNNRLIALVKDLLNVSKIESGKKFKIKKKPTSLKNIIDSAIKEIEPLSKEADVQIKRIETDADNIAINIDKEKIGQVVYHLINNATKFSKPKGEIKIKAEKSDDSVIISVKDNGIGIPKKQQKYVFDKFFRASNVPIESAGTGLGLYISKTIIENHGGKIWLESKENKGTTFYISLPINTKTK